MVEKPLGKLTTQDKTGHEKFNSEKEMYKAYKKYYQKEVGPETLVKIIRFKIIK